MVTELEKRWEEETEEEPENTSGEETQEESNIDYVRKYFIHNPLLEVKSDVDLEYMCLIESGVRRYMGSIHDIDPDLRVCVLSYPMEYSEQPRMTKPATANSPPMYEMGIGIKPMYVSLAGLEQAQFSYTSMYVFKSNRSDDLTLVGEYAEVFLGIMAANSNIVKPTQEDISKVNVAKS